MLQDSRMIYLSFPKFLILDIKDLRFMLNALQKCTRKCMQNCVRLMAAKQKCVCQFLIPRVITQLYLSLHGPSLSLSNSLSTSLYAFIKIFYNVISYSFVSKYGKYIM